MIFGLITLPAKSDSIHRRPLGESQEITDMTGAERNTLKDQLHGMIARQGNAIDFATPSRWVVEGIHQPEPFTASLSLLLPDRAILYFEGCSIAPEVTSLYERYRAANPAKVMRDTFVPVPATYHVIYSPSFIASLAGLLTTHALPEFIDHFKAYRDESLLFSFHDAFAGELLVSEDIPEKTVAEFCRRLGAS